MSERYKNLWVDPRAYQLADGTGWTAEVYLAEDIGPDTVDTQFVVKGVFQTREAALAAALAAGRGEVDKRAQSKDIRSVIEEETRLPSTHQHGFGSQTDDVATGADGQPTKVPGPDNPEDRFN
jgi:hypothetical protein